MADRNSARNRRNTPQSFPKSHDAANVPQQSSPHRTTRVTRSQSQEVSDNEAGPIGAKGGRRNARQANGQDLQGAKNEKNSSGSKEKTNPQTSAAQVDPELSVVAEEFDVANSNVQDMLDTLADLSAAAQKVAKWLLPAEISEAVVAKMRQDLLYPESRVSKNVKRLSNVLQAQKAVYGNRIEEYISTQPVLKALLGTEEDADLDESWCPNPIIFKANLSTFLIIITRSWGEQFNDEHFKYLEEFFPAPFLSRSSSIEDLSVAVEVRTQHLIMLFTRYPDVPNFDPDLILQQTFYVAEGNSAPTLKGWSAPGLKDHDLNDDYQALILRRLSDIRSHFSDGKAVYRPLKAAFPWNAFVTKMIRWSKIRLDDIDTLIKTHGGVDAILEALSDQVHSRAASGALDLARDGTSPLVELNYPSPSAISNTASDRSSLNRLAAARNTSGPGAKVQFKTPTSMVIGVQRLRGWEARYPQQQNPDNQSTAPIAIMGPSQAQNGGMSNVAMAPNDGGFMTGALNGDDWQPPQIEDEAMTINPDNDPREFALTVVQRDAMNKGNIAVNHQYGMPPPASTHPQALGPRKLIDRQPNAQRVEWEDPGFSQDVASNSTGTKRDHATAIEGDDIELDPSQDEGFQEDNRNPDIAAKRMSMPAGRPKRAAQGQRAPRKARNSQAQRQAQSQADNDDLGTAVNNYNQAGNPPPSTLDVYQASHDRALTVTASQPKKVQVRKAWTDEETQTLLELIEEHGTSWRLLKDVDKNNGAVLEGRDQVALKDKARNMKLDFLKASHELPENFQYVPLNKIQIQKLHDLGLEYDQDRGRRTASQ